MKKLFITGGSGFVGTHLTGLAVQNYEVYSVYSQNLPGNQQAALIQVDLTDKDQIQSALNQIKPDVIIHTAAISKPDLCEKFREMTEQVNILATVILATWAKKNNARFIFTSSDMVFDGKSRNYHESDLPNPISYYGETKALAERKLLKMDFNCVVARVALVYGIGEFHHENFFHTMVNNLIKGQKVNLFHDQFRTPIYVENLAEAMLDLAENNFTGVIHIGGSERISRWDFGLKTCDILDLPREMLQRGSMFDFPSAASRPQDVSMCTDLAKKVLKVKLLNCNVGLIRVKKILQ